MKSENKKELRELREKFDTTESEISDICEIVKQRNKSLFNLIRLLSFLRYTQGLYVKNVDGSYEAIYPFSSDLPKRGKKIPIPLKFVMEDLGVSHRTAQDYVRTVQAIDKLFNLRIFERLEDSKGRIMKFF